MTITIEQLLATLSVDEAQAAVVSGRLALVLRSPQPSEEDIPVGTPYTLTVVDLEGEAWDTSLGAINVINIYFDGSKIYSSAGGWDTGWTGSETGHALTDPYRFLRVDGSQTSPPYFTSEQVVTVRVIAEVTGVPSSQIDETYTFTCEDITPPKLLSAETRDQFTTRVTFDDEMATTGAGSVLQASLWSITRFNVDPSCGVNLTVASVAEVAGSSGTEFDLTFNWEMTPNCLYQVTISLLAEDSSGNAIDPTAVTADFYGYQPDFPADRFFSYWYQMIPLKNRQEDATQDLARWACCVQEVLDLLLYSVDTFTDQFDPDLATDAVIDAMLYDLGNPFDWSDLDLTSVQKRKLLRYLINIYKLKGTAVGVESVVFFLMGVVCRVVDYISDGWVLGVDVLGEGEIAQIYSDAYAPYDLLSVTQPPVLDVSVDGAASQSILFTAGSATLENVGDATWDFSPAPVEVLNVIIDGTPQVVSFPAAAFANPAAATAAEVAVVLTAGLTGAIGVVSVSGLRVSIETTSKGTDSSIRVTGGTANAILKYPTTEVTGTGDVANLSTVTAAEAAAILDANLTGGGSYVHHCGSPASLTNSTAGPYALVGGETLTININDESSDRTIIFHASDFSVSGVATATEIAARINTELSGAASSQATALLTNVLIETLLTGDNAKLQVTGGTAAATLNFPAGQTTGDDDDWKIAIYSDSPDIDASIQVTGGTANTAFDFTNDPMSGTGSALLAPSDLHTIYSFDIEYDGVITSEQEAVIRKIAEYMKPAHTHLKDIRPPDGLPWPDGWFLGEGALGDGSDLSA